MNFKKENLVAATDRIQLYQDGKPGHCVVVEKGTLLFVKDITVKELDPKFAKYVGYSQITDVLLVNQGAEYHKYHIYNETIPYLKKVPTLKLGSLLGSFQVTSGKLQITDPCYDKKTWCAGSIDNVRNGTWIGHVVRCDETGQKPFSDGIRNAELYAFHSDLKKLPAKWTKTKIHVGVDSGQAGIFDEAKYPEGGADDEAFYDACGKQTLGEYGSPDGYYADDINFKMAGVVNNFGVVSHSGYGDGGYNCYVYKQKGQVVAVKIVFIDKRGRGPVIPPGAVISKPLPDKSDHKYALEETLMRIAEMNAELSKKLEKETGEKAPDPNIPSRFQTDTEAVKKWNKENATYFPKWITREERDKQFADYRLEKGIK